MQPEGQARSGHVKFAAVRDARGRTVLSRRELAKLAVAGSGATAARLAGIPGTTGSSAAQSSPQSLTIATDQSPSDLDPHSAYDAGSGLVLHGPYEGLIRLQAGS
jgi:ABC-type transport system substrate-binding protein